jgi:Txe/YoeB family toxin of Txe-Axe toxin-antitoxin module
VKIVVDPQYDEEYRYWLKRNARIAKKIDALFDAICADPFRGIGHPEPCLFDVFLTG